MMRHLASLGHRHIAVIRGPEELFDSAPRWAGIRQAATEAGIRFDSRLVSQLPNLSNPKSGFEGGRKFAAEMLASGRKFTAVLAFDDLTALGVVRGLAEAGLRVPQDCSVVGFDDILPADVATPGITTIRQPLREMGLLATELMLHALKQGQGEGAQEAGLRMVQPELVVRTSSAAPGGGK
jgi:DNA-binding LacI/PurR family transcriptional regulator